MMHGTRNQNSANQYVPSKQEDETADETLYFERSRIKHLQDERVNIQKKTFTKWCNSYLNQARLEIADLFVDVCDGVMLMKLLEIISGDKLGKPNRGKMRVQKIENLNKVLGFLRKKKIQLENIGAEDILDRNERLILGLIWTIILRFQIDTITIEDEEEAGEKKHAKEALLLWCQRKTAGYHNVRIENFTTSWTNGLAFNALIHAHRPDLVRYENLSPDDHIGNLNNAFETAEKALEITKLLDAEDVDVARPDEKSIITYVSLYYHYFAKQKTEMTGARRIANIVSKLMDSERTEVDYEHIASELLQWIRVTTTQLLTVNFPSSLNGMREEHAKFNLFRTTEKPPKYKEKGYLEALFFTLQTKRKAMSRKQYVPPQGLLMHDIETAWNQLDAAENKRQQLIIKELQRQENLEKRAQQFKKKAKLRDAWLRSVMQILEGMTINSSADVQKTIKKQQAITSEVMARENRFTMLTNLCKDLCIEKYHESDNIKTIERDISDRWTALVALLNEKQRALSQLDDLTSLLRDLDTLSSELSVLEPIVCSKDVGKHILGVDDLLEKQDHTDAQISAHGSLLAKLAQAATGYIRQKGESSNMLQRKLDDVSAQYNRLLEFSRTRRQALERARTLYVFLQDYEEEMAWLAETTKICDNVVQSGDHAMMPQYSVLYKNTEMEMQSHWARCKKIINTGEKLIQAGQSVQVQPRLTSMNKAWDQLRNVVVALGSWISGAKEAQQYFQDCNEAESWMREKLTFVGSEDLGRDTETCEALLQKHSRLEEEIQAYRSEVVRLEEVSTHLATTATGITVTSQVEEVEELKVPQIEMTYKYEGNGIHVDKGEILALLEMSTAEWWRVLKQNGVEGFVPANYCRIIPNETVTVTQTTTTKKKTTESNENVFAKRQNDISHQYRSLVNKAESRRRNLLDNIKIWKFQRLCDDFVEWSRGVENILREEPDIAHIEAFRRRFDNLSADMGATGKSLLGAVADNADKLLAEGHLQSALIKKRKNEIDAQWALLNRLQNEQRNKLEACERVSDFNSICESARDWMNTKYNQLECNPTNVRSLQNLERDLKPLAEKIAHLENLAKAVRKDHPSKAQEIENQLSGLKKLYGDLVNNTQSKVALAEQLQGLEIFLSATKEVTVWIEETVKQLTSNVTAVDVDEAEDLLKKHEDLGEKIRNKQYEVDYCYELGTRLLERNKRCPEVEEPLRRLKTDMNTIQGLYDNRSDLLKQQLDLQLFNREAGRIDAITKGHEVVLEYNDLGDSVEAVESMVKRHRDLDDKLRAQEPRLDAFSKAADDLMRAKHDDSAYIDQRRKDVLQKRDKVKKLAGDRKRNLQNALEYQEWRSEMNDFINWIKEKRHALDDGNRNISSSVEQQLQKHETFAAEIYANEERKNEIDSIGAALISKGNVDKVTIERLIILENAEWKDLLNELAAKKRSLQKKGHDKALESVLKDLHIKLDELESNLKSADNGSDLRSAQKLLQDHGVLEQEINMYNANLTELEGRALSDQNKAAVTGSKDRYNIVSQLAAARKKSLQESLVWHQLCFDIDCQLLWIDEKITIARRSEKVRNLTDAVNVLKKQEQLNTEVKQHEDEVQQLVKSADQLCLASHNLSPLIRKKKEELLNSMQTLNKCMAERQKFVENAVRVQQYLSDTNELEMRMNESFELLRSEEYGNDEESARKLVTKDKTVHEDLQGYKNWLTELGNTLSEIVNKTGNEQLVDRQKDLEEKLEGLFKLAEVRQRALEDAILLHGYLRDSSELEDWINAQLQVAMSEDYAEDYEHLQELKANFEEFKQSVKTGSERFVICEETVSNILRRNPPFARDILKKQEKLRSVWTLLLDYIESREVKLGAAEELHKFNRDVFEFRQFIAEKQHNMPKDLGRNVNSVHILINKHDALEKEVKIAEKRLHALIEEANRLKQLYPGENEKHIEEEQKATIDEWEELNERLIERKNLLASACDLHGFNASIRDLLAWIDLTVSDIQSDVQINDLQQAEWLQQEHDRVNKEIAAREPECQKLVRNGEAMCSVQNYATQDIQVKTNLIKKAFFELKREWELRNDFLSQSVQWHAFARESKQIIALIGSKRTTLRSYQIGSSVTELEAHLSRLITFEKALVTVEDRISSLDQTASQLTQRNHIEKTNIEVLRQKVHDDLDVLLSDIAQQRALLMHKLQMAKFNDELNDSETWIEEKLNVFGRAKGVSGEEISNEEKMKRLQKHQAQEAEIAANQVLFDQLLKKVAEFCKFKGTDDLRSKSHLVMQKWNNLLAVSEEQYKALEEARDLLAFKQTITRLEDWINEKEVLVACKDLGRDYEHCRLLTTKLDDAKGSSIDENTLQDANRLGDKLIQQNTSEKEYVLGNLSALNKRWNALQGQIEEYRTNLRAALEVHSFNKEVDETNERIQEKILMMKNEDYGKDFASADILLRKHANLEREMSAIHKKLIHHEQEAQRLFEVQPDLQSTVVESLNKLEKSWGDLSDASKFRSTRLNEKYRLFKYFDDVKKTEVWMNQIRNRITLRRSPGNTEEAKLILDELHEIKAEIDGRQEELQKLYENGQTLIGEQPGHKAEIQRMHKRVQLVEHQLRQTWEVEKSSIQKLLEWQKWADEANQTERWLADKENLISQGDLGDNCDAVDMLIKTQIGLEKTISNYGEQVSQLMQKADALVASGNDGRSEFFERRDAITDRYASLIKKTDNRHALLNDSKRYHEFIRKCGELIIWITAKLQLAYDESFLDHTNLRSKLQKHLAFDSELTENEKRLTAVEDEGESMLQQKHFMSEQVRTQLEELRSGWEELKQKSALKSKRLRGAYDSNLLKRKLEENEEWLDKMENELSSDNHGRDLVSVEALIKKVDNLKNEISGREQNIEELVRKARAVTTSEATDEFLKHAEQLEHRYSCLKEPVEIREANLNDAKRMFIWSREAEEHFEWFGEKAHLISLNDIGENHQMLLGQQKKHAQLEKEMETRCSSIQDTCDKGLKMMGEKHFAAREIETTIHRLNADIATFKETCLLRRDLIQESMKAQEYLTDLAEVEQWIHEQMPLASSQEIGRDQMGAESNLRRLAVLEKDIETNKKEIHGLRNRADRFISEGHSFSSAIGSKQNFVEQLFNDLQAETRRRHTRLDDASKYFQFMTFADNLFDWLREREAVCCDEEYGRDLDDCVQITEKFETTVRELVSAGERVSVVQKMQEELLRSGHSYAASITAKGADIQRLWSRVNQAANERKMALGGAKQVHQFDQDADQMLNWLQEKEALEVAMEQEDLSKCDFASVKAQMERHDEFMHGMKAVEKQVADLCAEAERLCQNYPDTRPHLEVRKLDMTEQLKDILEAANSHSEKLDQLSNLQSFFQEYNEMIQWCKCMQTTITSELLPRDVLACNALTKRHDGYMIEIQGRRPQYDEFCQNGRRMITSKNVLSSEIAEKVTTLESAWRVLSEVWKDRKSLYDENMDCQQWKANANQLESWLLEKERVLGDDYKLIDSVDAADAHLRQFDDFLVTLDALDDKCELVKRLTLIEKNFTELRKKEVERVTVAQEESRRRDTIKILEKKDMLAGRRMERERRKTQEISLLINTPVVEERKMSVDNANYTLPRTDKSKKVEVLAMAKEVNEQPLEPIKVPSFNTRLNPVVKKKREDRGIIDMQGFIDRKQCLQAGGKRATIRSWKNYYAILCGQLMCFFKDEVNFKDNLASAPPLNIYGAKCEQFNEYVKRKNCFRLCTQDGADYVFVCDQESTMLEWVAKIQFHAALSPADQLTAYTSHRGGDYTMTPTTPTTTYETRVDTFDQPVNSLAYKEHTTLRFEPQLKRTVLSEATEFVSWVEEQDGKVVAPSFPSPSSSITSVNQTEENGSIKSTKRKGFSIFKRSSKANKF